MPLDFFCQIVANMPFVHIIHSTKSSFTGILYLCHQSQSNWKMTSKVIYKGALRTEATHIRSGNTIITDAPTDNKGKGEAFSPTDLVATALASCMLTIMGIKANESNINIEGASAEVKKIMATGPRRIAQVIFVINIPY